MNTVVSTLAQWNSLGSGITELTVPSTSLNDASLTVLDLTRFKRLKRIEIENVDALEVIEMGDLNEYSFNFYSATLELKSILISE